VVEFDGHFVTIRHKGALGRMTVGKGEKRIPLSSITSVQIKPAGSMVNGFIQFSIPGGIERRSSFGSQTFDAAGDENSVIFTKDQEPQFLILRNEIEKSIIARSGPQVQVIPGGPGTSKLDELKKLAELRDAGVLDEAEFAAEKQRIMQSGGSTLPPPTSPATSIDDPSGASKSDPSEESSGRKIGIGRIAGFVATGGVSEVARFAKKKLKD